jgi:hypothetical protein
MITKEGKIEKTKPGSTTIYYVVKDNEDGSGFYIEKDKQDGLHEENAQNPTTIQVGAYGTRPPSPSAPMEPDLILSALPWNPTAILSAPMEPGLTDACSW